MGTESGEQLSLSECLHQSGHLWPAPVLSQSLRPHRVTARVCSVRSGRAKRSDSEHVLQSNPPQSQTALQ